MGVFDAFADLMSYPQADLLAVVDACIAEVETTEAAASSASPEVRVESAKDLRAFRAEAERLGVARLEEAYTATFDLDPACALYVGHHLFGENARRGFFMGRLVEMFRQSGRPEGDGEPPDHLLRILRYLAVATPGAARDDLVSEAVIPVLVRVAGALEQNKHPYAPVVRALLGCLEFGAAKARGEETPA